MVLGEAGIGKTRLLQELDNAAGWRGWQVTWGRCEEFAIPAPYAPFSEALRAALPQPRREQLAQLLAPHS
jgi:predicted ATPase